MASLRELKLPVVPMSRRTEIKSIDVPWLIKSLLHSQGVNTSKLRIGAFLRMDREEREVLRANLLTLVEEPDLVEECNRFVDELARRRED